MKNTLRYDVSWYEKRLQTSLTTLMYSQSVTILAGQLDIIWNINKVSVLILIIINILHLSDYEIMRILRRKTTDPIACFSMYQVQVHGTL